MQIGDIVKSLDWNGIDDCYMIGKVVGISEMDGTFRAKFIKQVWCGEIEPKSKTDFFVAPLQGSQLLDNPAKPRVMVIG